MIKRQVDESAPNSNILKLFGFVWIFSFTLLVGDFRPYRHIVDTIITF